MIIKVKHEKLGENIGTKPEFTTAEHEAFASALFGTKMLFCYSAM
jgi:hypothetical protein